MTKRKTEELRVHPAANCFRLMREDEQAALAEDIKANGLRDPITLGRIEGRDFDEVVDGRNRYRVCLALGIEPQFEHRKFKNDDEVRAFVRSRSARRDLTKGERAASLALLDLNPVIGMHTERSSAEIADEGGVSERRLRQARQVGRYSIQLLEAVRDGVETLDDALVKVKADCERLQSNETRLAQLVAGAPDLAARVQDEGMDLSEAFAAYEQRKRNEQAAEQNKRETLLRLTESAYRGMTAWAASDFASDVQTRIADAAFRKQLIERLRFNPDAIAELRKGADAIEAVLAVIGGQTDD